MRSPCSWISGTSVGPPDYCRESLLMTRAAGLQPGRPCCVWHNKCVPNMALADDDFKLLLVKARFCPNRYPLFKLLFQFLQPFSLFIIE